ncbi:DUF7694 domain-containing protein [Bacillus sp. B-jedd]|uniref:DUF7694 domain-containing protein n=1 Tax=Bacillus sp. B-jedd TaxID=1476857 RepID=UPI000515682C|nr:hypothetical protein [Bacillus sp. B-jedd]CEG25989.1 hypothetical protein BN1002_00827 [Bacillus sp. B-jedd]CEG28100.1 hypothetical protein BN1002_02979 [Bacillus sp. B-jedd]
MNRAERRRAARRFEPGPPWIKHATPSIQLLANGWFAEVERVYSNREYAVLIRTADTEWGPVEHAAIRNVASSDITWAEKQRIKNEIFGPERIAIEVFPKESELVDEANMYHLWVLPEGMTLPFGIYQGQF